MTEEKKEYAQGIYIKKFEGKYGEWLSVSIKLADGGYNCYKFYPKKEQKNDKYIDFYGVFDKYYRTDNNKEEKTDENITNANNIDVDIEEIPF